MWNAIIILVVEYLDFNTPHRRKIGIGFTAKRISFLLLYPLRPAAGGKSLFNQKLLVWNWMSYFCIAAMKISRNLHIWIFLLFLYIFLGNNPDVFHFFNSCLEQKYLIYSTGNIWQSGINIEFLVKDDLFVTQASL